MFIRTERLFLRPGWPEDLEDVFEALNGDAVMRTLTEPGFSRSVNDIRKLLERPRNLRLPQFMIYLRAPGGAQLVGSIGLVECESEIELVYWIKSGFTGRGFAGEAVRALLDQARAIGHGCIVAWVPLDREEDARALLAAGFEDTFQVEERYSCVRGETVAVHRFEASLHSTLFPLPEQVAYAHSLSA